MRKMINIIAIGLGVVFLSACQANKAEDMNKAPVQAEQSKETVNEMDMSKENEKSDVKDEMKMDSDKVAQKENVSDGDMQDKMHEQMSEFDFQLEDVEGNLHSLSDYKGKKVYIKFWASWCSICLATLPETNELAGMDKDYEVIAVVAPGFRNEKSKESFIEWYKGLEYKNLTVLLDENGDTMKKYGVRAYPSAAFIDNEGNLSSVRAGHVGKEEIENILSELK